MAPPLAWLRARLAARPYDDDAHDDAAAAAHPGGAAPGFGAGWAELAAEARCSDAQLRAALAGPSLGALFLRGRHALLSRPYAARALRDALLTAQANGWGPLFRTGMPAAVGDAGDGGDGDPAAQPPPPPAGLPRRALLDAMQADGYERGVASFVLDRFCDRDDGDGANAAAGGAPPDPSAAPPTIVSFCAAAVGRHAAGVLLDSRPRWRLDAFASAWAAALPPELRPPRLAWLAGEGLVMPSLAAAAAALAPPPLGPGGAAVHAGAAAACTVLRLRLDELPPDPVARFDALFAARPVWPGDEVGPWLAGVEQPGATPDALLLRHARCSQPRPGGPKAYSAR